MVDRGPGRRRLAGPTRAGVYQEHPWNSPMPVGPTPAGQGHLCAWVLPDCGAVSCRPLGRKGKTGIVVEQVGAVGVSWLGVLERARLRVARFGRR